jgi:glycosyltransferase involved in cell wall biosynthesis
LKFLMDPKVAVIIPCYNQGHFLSEALANLKSSVDGIYEVIIVNDGSTDQITLNVLSELEKQGIKIINQENRGLSGARNTGINATKAEFIILLDADNKIRPSFITQSIDHFEKNSGIAVVYGDGMYFGDENGIRKQGPFNLQKQMLVNYIDACAAVRKSVLVELGGYDEQMKSGWEDWELWLRIGFKGYQFVYIPEVFFDYRIRNNSMAKNVYESRAKTNAIENYVYSKYPDKLGINYVVDFMADRFKRNPFSFLIKLAIRAYFPSYYDKLVKRNKLRNGL